MEMSGESYQVQEATEAGVFCSFGEADVNCDAGATLLLFSD